MEVTFVKPQYLYLLFVLPIIIFVHFYTLKHVRRRALKFANFEAIKRITGGEVLSKNILILVMRCLTVLFLILAAANTIVIYTTESATHDIVLALDASSSMLAKDYEPNRFEAAKSGLKSFVDEAAGKMRVGVVSFSGATIVEQGITNDMDLVKKAVDEITIHELSGTDLGQAMITSANMLSGEESKAVVLITDGQSNVGVDPEEALGYLKKEGVIIYPIGIGTIEGGKFGEVGAALKIDEDTLRFLAEESSGKYFHPTSTDDLVMVFKDIASFRQRKVKADASFFLVVAAVALLFVEWGLSSSRFKII
ncbi:VWA domain-containing protein [Candidatus Woesearchaeota archaeon]|nr:VWA domain-containing protein [Candidatus Woesearchaeota archaeon]